LQSIHLLRQLPLGIIDRHGAKISTTQHNIPLLRNRAQKPSRCRADASTAAAAFSALRASIMVPQGRVRRGSELRY
jgi:hypothetical protein